MNKYKYTILALYLLVSLPQASAELTVGIGIAAGKTAYKDYDSVVMPIPVIQYQEGAIYIDGLKAGVNVWDKETIVIDAHISYLPLEFKRSKTDDSALKKLDNRKSTMMAGVGLSHKFNQQKTEVKLSIDTDVLDNSKSILAEAELNHKFFITDKVIIAPAAGLVWANKDHNNYYYGVTDKEAAKSGVTQYDTTHTVHPYLGLHTHYQVTDNIALFITGRVDMLPQKVKDSPMVDHSVAGLIATGITYHF